MIVCSSCDKRPAFALHHHQHHSLWGWSSRLSMFQPNTCVLLEYTPVTKLTVDFFFKESWRRVKNYFADFVRKGAPPKSVILFLPWDKKQVFRGKKYHFQLFWRNLIGALFKLIDPFPVKPHWHLHDIIYSIEDPIFPLIHCFVCVISSFDIILRIIRWWRCTQKRLKQGPSPPARGNTHIFFHVIPLGKLSVAKMAKSTLGNMDVEHFA